MSDPVTYTGVLPIGEHTAIRLAQLLSGQRRERRTRRGRRALGPWRHAVLVLRWFLDATRVAQLAVDNEISLATAYRYLHEGIDVLAALAPSLHGALLAARLAGHTHVALDATLVRTDRSRAAGATLIEGKPVDLWWSGKHHHHGGNVQVVTAPDGWPLWVSDVRPGREHDITCARTHPELLPALDAWTDDTHVVLADLGYHGEADRLVCPIKKPAKPATLTVAERAVNILHSATRAVAELPPVARTPHLRWPWPPGRMSSCRLPTRLSSVVAPSRSRVSGPNRSPRLRRICGFPSRVCGIGSRRRTSMRTAARPSSPARRSGSLSGSTQPSVVAGL